MKKLMMVALLALTAGVGMAGPDKLVEPPPPPIDGGNTGWPVGFALAAPLEFPGTDTDVTWFRLGLFFARHAAVSGFDLSTVANQRSFTGLQLTTFGWTSGQVRGCLLSGLANVSDGSVYGFAFAPANVTHGDFRGLQIGAVDYSGSFAGLQVAALLNWSELGSRGFQIGTVNANQVKFAGLSTGAINYSYEHTGLQVGVVNTAEDYTGVQLGAVNACDTLHGIQIGVLNVIATSRVPILPVVNGWF